MPTNIFNKTTKEIIHEEVAKVIREIELIRTAFRVDCGSKELCLYSNLQRVITMDFGQPVDEDVFTVSLEAGGLIYYSRIPVDEELVVSEMIIYFKKLICKEFASRVGKTKYRLA